MIDAKSCEHHDAKSLCQHKDAKNRPCWVDEGREDMCPRSIGYQVDKLAQEEDAGER